jgi:hypothetical protein
MGHGLDASGIFVRAVCDVLNVWIAGQWMVDRWTAGWNFSHTSRILAEIEHGVRRSAQFAELERKVNGEGEAPRRVLSSDFKKRSPGTTGFVLLIRAVASWPLTLSSITSQERALL